MAIVKMKRLKLIALAHDRDALLESLRHVGCVEVREPDEYLEEGAQALLHRDSADLTEIRSAMTELQHALEILNRYAPEKTGMFAPRAQMRESELLSGEARRAVLEKASAINAHAKAIGALNAREARVRADRQSLEPWSACDLPLESAGTRNVDVLLGAIPNTASLENMAGAVDQAAGAAEIAERPIHALSVVCHRPLLCRSGRNRTATMRP